MGANCCTSTTDSHITNLNKEEKCDQQGLYLTIATLNYGSILNNPFQFFVGRYEEEYGKLSSTFRSLMPRYFGEIDDKRFKWDFGIDKDSPLRRYSPVFDRKAGVLADRMMTRAEYEAEWEKVFDKGTTELNIKCNEKQHETVKFFDLIMYHTLLKFVYGDKIKEIDEAQGLDNYDYIYATRFFYQLSFLSHQKKLQKFIDNLGELRADVFFLQEYSSEVYEYFKSTQKWHITADETKDTMIAVKKDRFAWVKDLKQILVDKLTQETRQKLNPKKRSSIMCVDDYILINAHLSSKKEKCSREVKLFAEGLRELHEAYPECNIIAGGDLNIFMELNQLSASFDMFPKDETELTTVKKRTSAQGQFNKADLLVEESKDKIIATKRITFGQTMSITGEPATKNVMLPSNAHPFDHYLIRAQVPL